MKKPAVYTREHCRRTHVQVRTVYQAKGAFATLGAGSTPLHAAAFRGDLGIVQAMLQVTRSG